jgi:hypothetical protein
MARDNYGAFEAEGAPLVPMEPEWNNPDEGGPWLKKAMDAWYVDKTHQDTWRSDSDPSNPNRRIPKGYVPTINQYDPYCDYAGYEAGNKLIIPLDEYKVAESSVLAVPVCYAEEHQTIDGQNNKERI